MTTFQLFAAALAAGCTCAVQADNRLGAIDPLTFTYGLAACISPNGQWVGGAIGGPQTSFIWNAGTATTTALPHSPTGGGFTAAISDSGTPAAVLVNSNCYRLTSSGYQLITDRSSDLAGMAADGSTIIGAGSGAPAWTWTEAAGYQTLPTGFALGGASTNAQRLAGAAGGNAVIRTLGGDSTTLTSPTGVAGTALAKQVSNDGSIVSGNIGSRACQWISGVPSLLPTIPGNPSAPMNVIAMADDGNVIFGNTNAAGVGVWVWTPELGTITIRQLLTAAGINVSGWSNFSAFDASSDGHSLVGFAGNGGNIVPFYVHLDQFPVPAPSGALLLGLGALLRARRTR